MKIWLNNRGMSLVQVMVAVGLTSIVTLGLSEMIVLSSKATKRTEVKMSSFVLINELQTLISVEDTCEYAITDGGTQYYDHTKARPGGKGLDISLKLQDGRLLSAGEQYDQNLDVTRLYLIDSSKQGSTDTYKADLMVEFSPRAQLIGGSLKPQQAGTVLIAVDPGTDAITACAKEPEITKKQMCEMLDGNFNNSSQKCTALNHVSCGYVKEAKKVVKHNEDYNTPYDSRAQICYKSGYCDSGKIYGKSETCYKHCNNIRTSSGRISVKHGKTSKTYHRHCSGRQTGGGSGKYTCHNGKLSGGPPGCRHDPGGGGGAGSSCFTADTKILMADAESLISIHKVEVGDFVLGQGGAINVVVGIERVPLGDRFLHSFNDDNHFITSEHPVKTIDQFSGKEYWKSFDPTATYLEHNKFIVDGALGVGDDLIRVDDQSETLVSSSAIKVKNQSLTVYNLKLEAAPGSPISAHDDRSHTYYANGYLVHNK